MKKKLRGELIFTLVLIATMAFLAITAISFPQLARFAPLLIGTSTVALLLLQCVLTLKEMKQHEEEKLDVNNIRKIKRLNGLFIALIIFLPLSYFFGFIPIVFIILGLYFKFFANESTLKSILISAFTCVLVYLIFIRVLSIDLPFGVIW